MSVIPELDQARIAAGEYLIVRVPRLKLDLVATGRVIVSAVPSHRGNTIFRERGGDGSIDEAYDWCRSAPGGRLVARVRQCRMDVGEEIVVGGRVRTIVA